MRVNRQQRAQWQRARLHENTCLPDSRPKLLFQKLSLKKKNQRFLQPFALDFLSVLVFPPPLFFPGSTGSSLATVARLPAVKLGSSPVMYSTVFISFRLSQRAACFSFILRPHFFFSLFLMIVAPIRVVYICVNILLESHGERPFRQCVVRKNTEIAFYWLSLSY